MTHSNRSAILLLLACFLLTAGWLGCKSPAPNDPTIKVPTVGSASVSDVKTTTAKVSSSITDVGFGALNTSTIKEYGICYGTKDKPTTADQKVTLGTSATAVLTMVAPLSGLQPGTTYYVRGYVVYDGSTVYGDQAQFTTDNLKAPELTTADAADLSTTAFSITGRLTALGTSDVAQYGHVLSATNQTPTTADIKTEMGATNAAPKDFKSVFSGLTANTTYYVRAYAINASGTGYSEVKTVKTGNLQPPTVTTDNITNVSAAGAGVGMTIVSIGTNNNIKAGVCWSSTNQTPTVNDAKTSSGTNAAQFFSNDLTGLSPNTTYYVRAYATNNDGTGYGAVKSFKTLNQQAPTVTTGDISNVTTNGATVGMNLAAVGTNTNIQAGVCWSNSNPNPTTSDAKTSNGANSPQFFSINLTNLATNTTYYVRAYATSNDGTGYGDVKTFKTQDITPPTISAVKLESAKICGGIFGRTVFYGDPCQSSNQAGSYIDKIRVSFTFQAKTETILFAGICLKSDATSSDPTITDGYIQSVASGTTFAGNFNELYETGNKKTVQCRACLTGGIDLGPCGAQTAKEFGFLNPYIIPYTVFLVNNGTKKSVAYRYRAFIKTTNGNIYYGPTTVIDPVDTAANCTFTVQ